MEKAKEMLLDVSEVQYSNRLTLVTGQLELQRREEEIYRNKQEVIASNAALQKERNTRLILVFFLIASILLGLILFFFIGRLMKQQKELSAQKDIITKTNEQLRAVVKQKETLLKEVNHRVKNNLSVLSSLLYLQEKNLKGEEGKMALKDGQVRVNSIALIHESFYQRKDMDSINFQDYFIKLGNYIGNIYTEINKKVEIVVSCEDLKLELAESIPLGMIINELMTNSFKYAFQKVEKPLINISFKNNALIYYDNGPGFQASFTDSKLGLQLVKVFTKQLKANLEIDSQKERTEVIIRFNE